MSNINKFKILFDIANNFIKHKDLYYVVEPYNWSIKHDGINITNNIKDVKSGITKTHYGIRNSIIHYGSFNTFFRKNGINIPHRSNKVVVTWFHVTPGDTRFEFVAEAAKFIDLWHTAGNITKKKIINLGVPENKIVVITLGVDLAYFSPARSVEGKQEIKKRLSIPENNIVIGSFQKDGVGWGKGLKPKMIKGPDLFCDAVESLSKKYDIFVLLTGPARGYVKKRLDEANIQYLHHYLKSPNDLGDYYKVLDLYIVTSREEGGPKSILESMASGVPLVSTKVGMVPEVIRDGQNGFIIEIDDLDALVEKASSLIEDETLRNKFISNGLEAVKNYDWKSIANKYYEKIYKKL